MSIRPDEIPGIVTNAMNIQTKNRIDSRQQSHITDMQAAGIAAGQEIKNRQVQSAEKSERSDINKEKEKEGKRQNPQHHNYRPDARLDSDEDTDHLIDTTA